MTQKTITIRIPVAVDPQGRWIAYGWKDNTHADMLGSFDYDTIGPNEALFWVTVTLPVPAPKDVEAEAVEVVS